MNPVKLGFVGSGKMANALLSAFLKKEVIDPSWVYAFSPNPENLKSFAKKHKIKALKSNRAVLQKAEVIFLAVKPAQIGEVLSEVQNFMKPQHLFISIAAGISLNQLEKYGSSMRLIRAMPNTACQIAQGVTALCKGQFATVSDMEEVLQLFRSVGLAIELPEEQFDAVTALAGSGPAFVFRFMDYLTQAALNLGLSIDVALPLVLQTVYGSAMLAKESDLRLEDLIEQVTSPKGTTAAGREIMEQGEMQKILFKTLEAAKSRSEELSQS